VIVMRCVLASISGLALLIAGLTAPPAHALAQFTVTAAGPSSLQAGLSGTYTVTAHNGGDVGAPVQLFIVFAGKLQQTGQIVADGGFDCTATDNVVRCAVSNIARYTAVDIVVQGRGSEPGAGQLVANINPDRSVPEDTTLGSPNDNTVTKTVSIT
jgi:hypothetical protein